MSAVSCGFPPIRLVGILRNWGIKGSPPGACHEGIESSLLLNGPLSIKCKQFNDRKSDSKSPIRGGVFQRSPLAVGNNGGGKISCCFFGDILKFCSPLAYISIHYRSIGRQVTKTHTKICFGTTFRLESCLSWRWNGQIKATRTQRIDAVSHNWGTSHTSP